MLNMRISPLMSDKAQSLTYRQRLALFVGCASRAGKGESFPYDRAGVALPCVIVREASASEYNFAVIGRNLKAAGASVRRLVGAAC